VSKAQGNIQTENKGTNGKVDTSIQDPYHQLVIERLCFVVFPYQRQARVSNLVNIPFTFLFSGIDPDI
jgi:hypothetical protein